MGLSKEYYMAQKNTPPIPERKSKHIKNANGQGTVYPQRHAKNEQHL
jgi:hypothetical protein